MERALDGDELVEVHPGLSPGVATGWVEAASVSLARHHEPARLGIGLRGLPGGRDTLFLAWSAPSDRARRMWADPSRATEWGSEALAAISLEAARGLVVIERAMRGSRVDFYLGRAGQDLEAAAVLEVAGIASGSVQALLKTKARQARQNRDRLPAIAAAVRFDRPEVMISDVGHG